MRTATTPPPCVRALSSRFASARRTSVGLIAARTSPCASIASGATPAQVATSVTSSPRSDRPPIEVAELEPRAREQLADDIVEHDDLALELVERTQRVVVARRVDQDADVAERRAQLVRHGREQLALIPHLRLDALGHVVDRIGEHVQLAAVAIGHADARVELARADVARGLDHVQQRLRQPPRDRAGAAPHHDERDRELPPTRAADLKAPAEKDAEAEDDPEPAEQPPLQPRLQPPRPPLLALIGEVLPRVAVAAQLLAQVLPLAPPAQVLLVPISPRGHGSKPLARRGTRSSGLASLMSPSPGRSRRRGPCWMRAASGRRRASCAGARCERRRCARRPRRRRGRPRRGARSRGDDAARAAQQRHERSNSRPVSSTGMPSTHASRAPGSRP